MFLWDLVPCEYTEICKNIMLHTIFKKAIQLAVEKENK